MSPFKESQLKSESGSQKAIQRIRDKKGQIIVEYILILAVSVIIALALANLTKLGDPHEQRSFIGLWKKALQFIGNDLSS